MRMLRSLFRAPAARSSSYALRRGLRAYAIGDVHGRRDLLEALLSRIDAERSADPREEEHLILLGDVIDRGPDSSGVIDLLLARARTDPTLTVLSGNHEEMLLAILDGAVGQLEGWLRYGGDACAKSYGIEPEDLLAMSPDAAQQRLQAAIPPAHVHFLRTRCPYLLLGGYAFVHAGVRPGLPIERQLTHDLHWIRAPFLRSSADHGAMIVHGHSISDEPVVLPNRIGIDTGAYASGKLTALCIDGPVRRFVAVQI